MSNNFEAKHPRARDGKFTEKLRKESGMTLELEQEDTSSTSFLQGRGEIVAGKVINFGDLGVGAGFVSYECPEYEDIAPGVWHVKDMRGSKTGPTDVFYNCSEGEIMETYRPGTDPEILSASGNDGRGKSSMLWDENGTLREVANFYTRDEILEEVGKNGEYLEYALYDDIGKPLEKTVILGRGLDADGNTKLVRINYSYDEEDEDGNEMHTSEVRELW